MRLVTPVSACGAISSSHRGPVQSVLMSMQPLSARYLFTICSRCDWWVARRLNTVAVDPVRLGYLSVV